MTHDTAWHFWRAYIHFVSREGVNATFSTPLIDFNVRAGIGEFDKLSDDQYYAREAEAKELSVFWNSKKVETAGNILTNAMAKTDISNAEIEMIADILAEASTRSNYSAEEPAEPKGRKFNEGIMNPDLDFSPVEEPTPFDKGWTPRIIFDYLSQHVYGQEAAKRAASILMYHHLKGNSRNIVMAGATGCGKTEIWRALSKKFGCIRIVNGPQLTCDGWKGSYHIKDIFIDETRETAEHLVIVIDEADKLFEPAIGSSGTDFARKIQDELLKIMDGDMLTFVDENNKSKKITVDCSSVSMVFCGSFEHMLEAKTESSKSIGFGQPGRTESTIAECTEEDLIQYGNVRREIAGRISRIVTLDVLDVDDFEAILESPASPIHRIEESHHVSLSVDKDTRRRLAVEASESGLGCRFIRSRLQAMLDEQMFDEPDAQEYSLCYE